MIIHQDGEMFVIPNKWLDEHDKQIREKVIDEVCEFVIWYMDGYYFKTEDELKEYVKENLEEQNNG